jgi:hypothetical protein
MNDAEKTYPGPEPNGETPVSENPAFVSACMAVVATTVAPTRWRPGNFIITHSSDWGFVFRIDLLADYRAKNSALVNRFVCWSADENDTVLGTILYSSRRLKPL